MSANQLLCPLFNAAVAVSVIANTPVSMEV
jgi:hypothetical protein